MGSSPTRGSSFLLGKVTALGVLCCFALLFVSPCLLLPFFLLISVHYIHVQCMYMYACEGPTSAKERGTVSLTLGLWRERGQALGEVRGVQRPTYHSRQGTRPEPRQLPQTRGREMMTKIKVLQYLCMLQSLEVQVYTCMYIQHHVHGNTCA